MLLAAGFLTEMPSNRWLLTVAEERDSRSQKRKSLSFRTMSMKQKQVAKEHMTMYRLVTNEHMTMYRLVTKDHMTMYRLVTKDHMTMYKLVTIQGQLCWFVLVQVIVTLVVGIFVV